MGNSASTEQQTNPTTSSTAAEITEKTDHQEHYGSSNNNPKQYTEELSTEQRQIQQQEQHQGDSSAPPFGHSQTPFQISITEPSTTSTTTMTNPNITSGSSGWTSSTSNTVPIDTTSSPKPVPGKSGWVSSTGASSPWYGGGSLSSSASSTHHPQPSSASYQQQSQRSHRQSISGPYYRARGLSVNQQQEPTDEDMVSPSTSSTYQPPQPTSQQPSPSVSTAHQQKQPPRLQLQQLQLNSSSPASPVSYTKSDTFPKEKAPTDSGVPTIITWTQGGDNVYVTGTFNGWKHKIKLVKSTHDFNTVVDLPLGTHRLKFIVDDEWKCSNDMETATDPDGNLVNYLQVMDEDDMDDELGQEASDGGRLASTTEKEEEEYTSEIPKELLLLSEAMQQKDTSSDDATASTSGGGGVMDPQQKRNILERERKQPQPPSLPPHLEKVLLNSHAVSNEDNSVLPVPHHVTLNHLYACSIKDHVMALSSTTRYRKKYSGEIV
ncbi:5'-AMP-activated protein kinase beta subunit, interation domain-domain-containing protein [Absidia repens]|uniref:5'-AMP-activated protein kinase beta subunit, interation domain-domain-containing protein n=1 Tax=Absidia repens TaxID=90262 RepID=A0A1X2IF63_9FUNG|nr:5'-AMP-activated protein kinase beta subunit, interation domain-domain-containing protein [Absidia repens]